MSQKDFPFTSQFLQRFIRFFSIPLLVVSIITFVLCFKENRMYKRGDEVSSKVEGVKGISYTQILCYFCTGTYFFGVPACLNYTWFRVQ